MPKWRRWLGWLKERRRDWPICVALVVAWFNTEFAIPFVLVGVFHLTGQALYLGAGGWASTEMCWWFWFSNWLYKEKIRKLKTVAEVIDIGQEAVEEFDLRKILRKKPGDSHIVSKVKDFARHHGIENFDLDNYQENPLFVTLRRLGYALTCIVVFILGFLPWFWILGLMICRVTRLRMAYILLFFSNFWKNYFLAYFYEDIGFWWFLLFFIAVVLSMSYVAKRIVKNLKASALKG